MNNLSLDQFAAVQKSNVEALFSLSQSAFQGFEKLVELNLQDTKAAYAEVADSARAALAVKDVQQLFALQQSLVQASAQKALVYGRSVYEIAAATNAEVARVAESQFADAQQKAAAVVEAAVKNAPAGSENVVALVKSAVSATQNAVESVQKAAKQAASVADANLRALTKTAETAAKAPARGKRG